MEKEIMSEEELLRILDISKDTLDRLRNRRGFPYVALTRTNRVYLGEDVHFWLEENRVKQ
ncbi:MAG: hypothetical protein C4576_10550 [Desulfobacteraceae bacterium]|jgi:arsenate reductase-like glutaredoxin family protein|nr:MAG: hypothetical protein C4576_10550 [Desulfobacteraceae bacterium]